MDDRTVIEWDKDDIDAMGMLKIDCLGLGMLTCIRKAFELLEEIGVEAEAGGRLTIADVMANEASDDAVYAMISRADTLGVFQIESRAQMSMLPAPQAALLLRLGHRGRHRPPRPDPGRHGPPVPPAP